MADYNLDDMLYETTLFLIDILVKPVVHKSTTGIMQLHTNREPLILIELLQFTLKAEPISSPHMENNTQRVL